MMAGMEPQLVRVIGPVIAEIDQFTAFMNDMLGRLATTMEVLVERIEGLEEQVRMPAPAPEVTVLPATVQVTHEPLTQADIAAIAEAVRSSNEEIVEAVRSWGGKGGGGGPTPVLAAAGRRDVRDYFRQGEALASQSGPGPLTFTFTSIRQLVVVRSVGGDAWANPFGGVAADGVGVLCPDGEPVYLPVESATVSVAAPAGATVYVYGLAY